MTNIHHHWSDLLLFLLFICCTGPLQGFKGDLEERILNATPVDAGGNKTVNVGRQQEANEHPEENSTRVLLGHVNSQRRRRNIVDDARESVKSSTEKLAWIKKNFQYLLLIVGSIFFLFFSCAAYRRLTRNKDDEEGDEVKVVVIGGPREKSSSQGTSSPATEKGNKASNSSRTKKPSKPSTKATRKSKNAKPDRMKGKRNKADGAKESESYSHRNDYSNDYDSSDSDVILDDYMHACAEVEDEQVMIKQSKTRIFDSLLNHTKTPFPQIKIDACVINEGIPLSSYTSFQQTNQSETELNICEPTMQYVDEIRKRAEILYGKRRATYSTTSYSQCPVLEDWELDKRLVASTLERCGPYHPMASTRTCLPITAAAR